MGAASFTITSPLVVAPGQDVVGTATDPNNNTSEFTALVEGPDLIVTSLDVELPPSTLARVIQLLASGSSPLPLPGPSGLEDLTARAVVRNEGTATANGPFLLSFYASADDRYDDGDEFLGSELVNSLGPNMEAPVEINLPNPLYSFGVDFNQGFYIIAYADRTLSGSSEVQESNESNNTKEWNGCDTGLIAGYETLGRGLAALFSLFFGPASAQLLSHYLANSGQDVDLSSNAQIVSAVRGTQPFKDARDNSIEFVRRQIATTLSQITSDQAFTFVHDPITIPQDIIGLPRFKRSDSDGLFFAIHRTQGSSGVAESLFVVFNGSTQVTVSGTLRITLMDRYEFDPLDAQELAFARELRHLAFCGEATPFTTSITIEVPLSIDFTLRNSPGTNQPSGSSNGPPVGPQQGSSSSPASSSLSPTPNSPKVVSFRVQGDQGSVTFSAQGISAQILISLQSPVDRTPRLPPAESQRPSSVPPADGPAAAATRTTGSLLQSSNLHGGSDPNDEEEDWWLWLEWMLHGGDAVLAPEQPALMPKERVPMPAQPAPIPVRPVPDKEDQASLTAIDAVFGHPEEGDVMPRVPATDGLPLLDGNPTPPFAPGDRVDSVWALAGALAGLGGLVRPGYEEGKRRQMAWSVPCPPGSGRNWL